MNGIQIFLLVFAVVETLNVLELYFLKDRSVFNGVSIFSAWEDSKQYPEMHMLIRYLVNWLAGVKLIVICILVVVVFTAPEQTILLTAIVLLLAIASYFWRMHPMLKQMSLFGLVCPAERAKQLTWMLTSLELGLVVVLVFDVLG